MLDKTDAAQRNADEALRLSPLDPMRHLMFGLLALVNLRLGKYEDAAEHSARAVAQNDGHLYLNMVDMAASALSGQKDRAQRQHAKVSALRPDIDSGAFSTRLAVRSPELKSVLQEGFRAAGLP